MKLTLDHTQRLNLHALLGALLIRAIWGIQDRIALDAAEEKAVELKREMVAGQERVAWNPTLSIPAKDFEFTDPEVARLKAAIQTVGLVRRRRRAQVAATTGRDSFPDKPRKPAPEALKWADRVVYTVGESRCPSRTRSAEWSMKAVPFVLLCARGSDPLHLN
jgi:hypothetical protein